MLLIPKRHLAYIISQALMEDPNECCGILFGRDFKVLEAQSMPNVHTDKVHRYSMAPLDILKAQNYADDNHLQILGIYHSHTYTQAYPSDTDIHNAVQSGWTNIFYILISLVEKVRPIVRAFYIDEQGYVTEHIVTTDGQPYRGSKVSE